jgi:hypothetical protein
MTYQKMGLVLSILSIFILSSVDAKTTKKKKDLRLEKTEDKEERKEQLKTLNKSRFKNASTGVASEEAKKKDYAIGEKLSKSILSEPNQSHTVKDITVSRIIAEKDNQLGADILNIGGKAGFSHVNSVVRVVTSYISNTFQYDMEDSELLGLYVVYYNLKHRKNVKYTQKFYTDQLSMQLEKNKIGIPAEIKDMNGDSQILIPIEGNILKGTGIDVATFELEDQVNPDIDTREGGSDTKKKFSKFQTKKLDQEKSEIDPMVDEIDNKIQAIEGRKKSIEDRLKELYKDPVKNKAEIARLEAEKKKLESQISNLSAEREKIIKKHDQLARREDMKRKGITSEREYIEKYAQKETKKATPEVAVKTEKKEEPKNIIAPNPNEKLVISPKREISTNKYYTSFRYGSDVILGKEFIVVSPYNSYVLGYELKNPTEDKVFLLNTQYKKIKDSGNYKLAKTSPLLFGAEKVFAFEEENGTTYISSFDKDLNRVDRGPAVSPYSSCAIHEGVLVITEYDEAGQSTGTKSLNLTNFGPPEENKKEDNSEGKRLEEKKIVPLKSNKVEEKVEPSKDVKKDTKANELKKEEKKKTDTGKSKRKQEIEEDDEMDE